MYLTLPGLTHKVSISDIRVILDTAWSNSQGLYLYQILELYS